MLKRLFASLAAAFLALAPAHAQETCQPEKLAAAIDTYAAAPFSARSWRMLKGLGDPGVAPSYHFEDDWAKIGRAHV